MEAVEDRAAGRVAGAVGSAAAVGALGALVGRGVLLLGTPEAHGYDGWYYVLQVRSWLAGTPRFADDSWAFWPMALAGWGLGDVVLGNALVAMGSAATATALLAFAGGRVGGAPGAWWAAAVAAASTGHMSLSAEFLKNGVGLVPLAALWLVLCRPLTARGLAACALFVTGAAFTHKLCGVLAVLSVAGAVVGAAGGRSRRGTFALATLVGIAGAVVLVLGTLRPVDLLRGLETVELDRWSRIRASSLTMGERLEVAAVHGAFVLMPLAMWRGAAAQIALPLAGLAVLSAAPGLPFSFEGISWRLLCMGFLPLALLGAACQPGRWVAGGLVAGALVYGPSVVAAHSRRSPDYPAWREVLPTITATVPPGGRLVAHRGLCGFLWAETDRPCENFEPAGDGRGVWRVAYGVAPEVLAEEGAVVPLRPGYVLIEEPAWRRYRDGAGRGNGVVRSLRNPDMQRPAWVYGPLEVP